LASLPRGRLNPSSRGPLDGHSLAGERELTCSPRRRPGPRAGLGSDLTHRRRSGATEGSGSILRGGERGSDGATADPRRHVERRRARRADEAGWTVAGVLAHLAFWDQADRDTARPLGSRWAWAAPECSRQLRRGGRGLDQRRDQAAHPGHARPGSRPRPRWPPPTRAWPDSPTSSWPRTRTGGYIKVSRAEHRREHLDEIEQVRSRRWKDGRRRTPSLRSPVTL
jgi:hypothetical protein